MKTLTSILAIIAFFGSVTLVQAQAAKTPEEIKKAEDDCKKQNSADQDACLAAIVGTGGVVGTGAVAGAGAAGLGGLGIGGLAAGLGALAIVGLASGGSGGHSSSH